MKESFAIRRDAGYDSNLCIKTVFDILTGILWGFLFGLCFILGLAFLGGNQPCYETSGSMRPVLQEGSLLFVKEKTKYGRGDIIVFYAEHEGSVICVTHRIVGKNPDGSFITKGDANRNADRTSVKTKDIIGKVTGCIPFYGYPCAAIKEMEKKVYFFVMS